MRLNDTHADAILRLTPGAVVQLPGTGVPAWVGLELELLGLARLTEHEHAPWDIELTRPGELARMELLAQDA